MTHEVSLEERFLFDTQGFLLLRNVLSSEECGVLKNVIERVKCRFIAEPEVLIGKQMPAYETRFPGQIRFNGIFRMASEFDVLIDQPYVLKYLKTFMEQPLLGNAWMIQKAPGADTGVWHRGIAPWDYTFREEEIRTKMLNVIYFLDDNGPDDGCVVAIPGSHKSNLSLNWAQYKNLEMPGATPVTGKAGDVFMFSEAVVHNGLPKTTPGTRSNLYFNYVEPSFDFSVVTYRAPLDSDRLYVMPPSIRQRWTPAQRELTHWMEPLRVVE